MNAHRVIGRPSAAALLETPESEPMLRVAMMVAATKGSSSENSQLPGPRLLHRRTAALLTLVSVYLIMRRPLTALILLALVFWGQYPASRRATAWRERHGRAVIDTAVPTVTLDRCPYRQRRTKTTRRGLP